MVIVKTSKVHLWVGEISICMSTDAAYWYFLIQVSVRTLSSHLTWRRTRVFQWLLRWSKSLNCLLGACMLWWSWLMHSCSRRCAAGGPAFRLARWFRQCSTLHQQMEREIVNPNLSVFFWIQSTGSMLMVIHSAPLVHAQIAMPWTVLLSTSFFLFDDG